MIDQKRKPITLSISSVEHRSTIRTRYGNLLLPFKIEVVGVTTDCQPLKYGHGPYASPSRMKVSATIQCWCHDSSTLEPRRQGFSHFVEVPIDTPKNEAEAEAIAATMRFIIAHELAELLRKGDGTPWVNPHPDHFWDGDKTATGVWDRPMTEDVKEYKDE